MSPRLPDSTCYATEDDEFACEGLKLEPIVPMKKWNISYKGQLKYLFFQPSTWRQRS